MSSIELRRWTCDRCGREHETELDLWPGGWGEIEIHATAGASTGKVEICNVCYTDALSWIHSKGDYSTLRYTYREVEPDDLELGKLYVRQSEELSVPEPNVRIDGSTYYPHQVRRRTK